MCLRSNVHSRMLIELFHSPNFSSSCLLQPRRNQSFSLKKYLGQLAWEENGRKKQSFSQIKRISSTSRFPNTCTEGSSDALYEFEVDEKDVHISLSARVCCPRYGQENVNLPEKEKSPFLIGRCTIYLFSSLKGLGFHLIDFLVLFTTLGLIIYTFVFTVGTTLMNF